MKRYDLELTATGPVMEEHEKGAFVPFSEVEKLQSKIYGLLEERNSTDLAIDKAIISGIVPNQHPIRSRLKMLANHHKREQALTDGMVAIADRCKLLADLLQETKESVYYQLESPDNRLSGDDAGKLIGLQERIDTALAGKLPKTEQPSDKKPSLTEGVFAGLNAAVALSGLDRKSAAGVAQLMLDAAEAKGDAPCDIVNRSSNKD